MRLMVAVIFAVELRASGGYVERIAKVIEPVSLETIETEAACLNDFQMGEIVVRTESLMCIDLFDILPELRRFAILQDDKVAEGRVIAG